ncbi:hypothetical protein [Kushneria phosphatilytica]|uniref:hypothetical protein n=1 Tax=Kushneria phosphatilytica TaxID=657387 RepID=UPI00143A8A8D|nr:hypothetical protein [Kushneria phosphatilytica]
MADRDTHDESQSTTSKGRNRLPSIDQHLSLYIMMALASTFILGFLIFGLTSLFG